jgi:hypothetical protein
MRPRISTTVDGDLLQRARSLNDVRDAELFDAALRALIASHEHIAEDKALADYPYTIDFGSLPVGVSTSVPLDDYLGDPPDDVVEYFRVRGMTASNSDTNQ